MSGRRRLLVSLLLACGCAGASPTPTPERPPVAGDWSGAIQVPGAELGVVLRFTVVSNGLAGTLSVPVQRLEDLPFESVTLTGTKLRAAGRLPNAQEISLEGELDGQRIQGHFTQGAARLPFRLVRGAGGLPAPAPAAKRTARSTEAYTEELVTVRNGDVALAGTLSVPRGVESPPVAVLITGSGPQDRDETVFGLPVFAQVADAMARAGVAVLRLDDRGVAESTGTFRGATTADFASDARAALAFLRGRGGFGALGLLGHSEGGVVAPLVASQEEAVSFVVLLAPPTVPFEQVLAEQKRLILEAEGQPPMSATAQALDRRFFAAIREGTVDELERSGKPEGLGEAEFRQALAQARDPWIQWLVRHDPKPALEGLRCPTLALFGGLDLQVPAASNAPPLQALAGSAKADVTVRTLPGLNHLFQKAKSGAPSEYGQLAKEVDASLLQELTGWLRTRVVKRG